jgi:hypothetical protein
MVAWERPYAVMAESPMSLANAIARHARIGGQDVRIVTGPDDKA